MYASFVCLQKGPPFLINDSQVLFCSYWSVKTKYFLTKFYFFAPSIPGNLTPSEWGVLIEHSVTSCLIKPLLPPFSDIQLPQPLLSSFDYSFLLGKLPST